MNNKQKYLELWGDLVSSKDLIQAIILSGGLTMVGYFVAPSGDTTRQLFFGLGGAVLAMVINSITIKPKRDIQQSKNREGK
ncbi:MULTISPECIES: hypothetical protein [unclassified Jeotgalibaca]|uniref:hypothetical protein n=1 Tax=unclassified Jeotgalibaca TaxID=2621505 RepID=UPI003FD0378B